MSNGFVVLGYIFLGVVIFAAFFLALMCHHWDAKRKKKIEEEERTRQTGTHSLRNQVMYNPAVISDGNCATTVATPPIWTTQTSMMEASDGYNHNTLPRLEVRYPRREIRRQSDADILFGNATIFGFVNERIEIDDSESVHSGSTGTARNSQTQDGLPTYHEAINLPNKGEESGVK